MKREKLEEIIGKIELEEMDILREEAKSSIDKTLNSGNFDTMESKLAAFNSDMYFALLSSVSRIVTGILEQTGVLHIDD